MKNSPTYPIEKINELIELKDELENYFRNTIIPQLFVDANYILRRFTPPAMKQFNLKPSDLGRNIGDLSDNIRFTSLLDNIKSVIESKQDFEKEIQTTDFRWYQMNILPYIIVKENRANGVIITFVDITDRINTLKEVERLNADHETFIYTVSHDLKGPVANAKMLFDTWKALDNKNSEEAHSIVDMIYTSLENTEKIIIELGDISRTKHNLAREAEKISFENVFSEVKLTLKEDITSSYAILTTEFNVHEIKFVKKNMRSIIYNLVSNSIKYRVHGRRPEIFIKTEKINGYVLLRVRDNGMGIAEEKKENIFREFTRVNPNDSIGGTGIGLYLVIRMVDSSGGKIEIESTIGKGSEFKIYFKAA